MLGSIKKKPKCSQNENPKPLTELSLEERITEIPHREKVDDTIETEHI